MSWGPLASARPAPTEKVCAWHIGMPHLTKGSTVADRAPNIVFILPDQERYFSCWPTGSDDMLRRHQ